MTDFWTEEDGPELWIDYYGEYGHPDPTCDEIGKSRRKSATERDICPECGPA